MATKSTDFKSALGQLEDVLDTYLVDKAPFTLPSNVKETIVNFAPWISLVVLVLAIPGILLALGMGALVAPITGFMGPAYAISYSFGYTISMIILAVSVILEAIAIPGLFKREKKAWSLIYYAALINGISGIIGGNLIGGLLGALIGLYFLFQIKSYYK